MGMAEFKKWISYLYRYRGGIKGNTVGFVRVEIRDGWCRLTMGIKGIGECDTKLEAGIYVCRDGQKQQLSVGMMRICQGQGSLEMESGTENLFGQNISVEEWEGVWLKGQDPEIGYLAFWEWVSDPMPCEPSLWDSMARCYPRIWPEWQQRGIEVLQIRPADIRHLPRHLWYYGSNSFLLHGYYQYKHLVLGRVTTQEECSYLLGVPGQRCQREHYTAGMFGFHHFLPAQGQEGYWYTKIRL